jgi:hypothetical protein
MATDRSFFGLLGIIKTCNSVYQGTDLRTAAFLDAIDKIAVCYQDPGIFP